MPRYELDGQVAIVTGAGRGIGRAIARRLAHEGASVAVSDLDVENAAGVADEITAAGGKAISLRTDVSSKADADRVVEDTVAHFGRLDILVNNAGIGAIVSLLDTDESTWDALMNVNAKGYAALFAGGCQANDRPGHGGRIINNASGAGKMAPGKDIPLGAYAASKHAVVAITKQMGLELSSHGILVNCVCAGIVDTPMWDLIDREIAKLQGVPVGSVKAGAVASIPVGRIEQPEDVANMFAFLASEDANYLTAQTYNICGGILPY